MKWYELSTLQLISVVPGKSLKEKLANALDIRYGNYDYSQDLRSAHEDDFIKIFKDITNEFNGHSSNLVCGANSGYEIDILQKSNITALDLSQEALSKLKKRNSKVKIQHESIDRLPFEDNTFDLYIALRTIQCESVDMKAAISESVRVTKNGGRVIFSIPNGYYINNKIVKGIYLHDKRKIDTKAPYKIANDIKTSLEKKKLSCELIDFPSEIFIVGDKSK